MIVKGLVSILEITTAHSKALVNSRNILAAHPTDKIPQSGPVGRIKGAFLTVCSHSTCDKAAVVRSQTAIVAAFALDCELNCAAQCSHTALSICSVSSPLVCLCVFVICVFLVSGRMGCPYPGADGLLMLNGNYVLAPCPSVCTALMMHPTHCLDS